MRTILLEYEGRFCSKFKNQLKTKPTLSLKTNQEHGQFNAYAFERNQQSFLAFSAFPLLICLIIIMVYNH